MPTREDAWKIVCEFTQSESLRKHMLAVETCVRAYARKNGADENTWGLAALLHDFDYERWPNTDHAADREHPAEGAKILREPYRASGILQHLHRLQPGDLIEEPAAACVHQHRVPLHFQQFQRGNLFFARKRMSCVLA